MNPARQRWVRLAATLAPLLLSACATRAVAPPPTAPPTDAGDALVVLLTWASAVDLDLYVTDPSWETVYFANNPSRSGGRLEHDQKCRADGADVQRVELVRVPNVADGMYRVGVDFIDACGTGLQESSYRVVATLHGETRDVTGVAHMSTFAPIVLEFQVRQGALERG